MNGESLEDWKNLDPVKAQHLMDVISGRLLLCHGCYGTFPPATLITRGTIQGGLPRRFCMQCRSEERNYAYSLEEECEYCGIIRKKLGSRVCSAECADLLAEFGKEHPHARVS